MRSDRLFSPLILILLALLALAADPGSRAQETPPVKARYTKHEYQIAMRDGVKLFTSVYVPKDSSEAYVFESGSNVWKRYESWPPKGVESKSLYLHSDGKLSFDPPEVLAAALAKGAGSAYDEYVSDPNKPAPFQNRISAGMSYEYMTDDQRFSASRPDVLVYQTDVLAEDVTIAGELFADLYASTSGTDSDFVVKLIDVFPERKTDPMDGYQMLVRGEPMRAKYRNSWSKPEPMKPNEVTHIPFTMPDVNHTFKKGHRIMIHVQSAWFPLVDRNPQKFMNIYQAKDEDFQKATQRIYRSAKFPTHLKIGVLKLTV